MKEMELKNGNRYGFTMIPNDILRSGHNPRHVVVLLVIASHAGEGGTCFASTVTIAKESGVRKHMVIEAIKFWEGLGVLGVERRDGYASIITTRFDFSARITRVENDTTPVSKTTLPPVSILPHLPVSKTTPKEEHLKKNPLRRIIKKKITLPKNGNANEVSVLVERFFSLKGWEYDPSKAPTFRRHLKPARDLLDLCNGDIDTAEYKLKQIKFWADANDLDWSIETVLKKWFELDSLASRIEQKKRAFIGKDRAYKDRSGNWHVILENGEHKRYIGSLTDLHYE